MIGAIGAPIMRMIDAAEIRRLLTFPLLVDAFEAAHRRPRMEAQDTFMGSESALYSSVTRSTPAATWRAS